MNDDNEEKCYGNSTYFIRILIDQLFIIIGEKATKRTLLRKMYCLKRGATLTCVYGPIYLQLDDYPQYSDNNQNF